MNLKSPDLNPNDLNLKNLTQKIKFQDFIFRFTGLIVLMFSFAVLLTLIIDMFMTGFARLDYLFFTSFPSRFPEKAGILSAWVGSLSIVLVTAFISIPLGVATGVYLEEYAKKNWLSKIIELNILNLAGIPSIIYGIMSLSMFVYQFRMGQSILTAGLTLGLLVLPIIIVTTREAIRTIPGHIR